MDLIPFRKYDDDHVNDNQCHEKYIYIYIYIYRERERERERKECIDLGHITICELSILSHLMVWKLDASFF